MSRSDQKPKTMKITIPVRVLKGLDLLSLKGDPQRPLLNGVCLQSSGDGSGFAVATNGRFLGILRIPDGFEGSGEIIVPSEIIRHLKIPEAKKHQTVTVFDEEPRMCCVVQSRIRYSSEMFEVHYPGWKQLIPKTAPVPAPLLSFNPAYFAQLAKSSAVISGKTPSVHIHYYSEKDAMGITTENPDFYALLMPVRVQDDKPMPDWVESLRPK
jgi:DNA polymerase III sliding clamp (beta) subunit (PCNA family)